MVDTGGLQPADVPALRALHARRRGDVRDLAHDLFRLRRLGVRDEDRELLALVDAIEFLGQRVRREVQAALGEVAFTVAEGRLDHQRRDVQLVDAAPEGGPMTLTDPKLYDGSLAKKITIPNLPPKAPKAAKASA